MSHPYAKYSSNKVSHRRAKSFQSGGSVDTWGQPPTIQGYKKAVDRDFSHYGGRDRIPSGTYKDPDTGETKRSSYTLAYPGGGPGWRPGEPPKRRIGTKKED